MKGRAVVAGSARGVAVVSKMPLSLWGGLDPATGKITDRLHDRFGEVVAGRVFAFPTGKGSSTASAVLLESVRLGTAPAAIINSSLDPILALGAIVANELYGRFLPVVVVPEEAFAALADGDEVAVEPDGTVEVRRAGGGSC